MELARQYQRQFAWRPWSSIFDVLPPLDGRLVLDLGCGIGDQAVELRRRGARVIGIEAVDELFRVAQSKASDHLEFRLGDFRAISDVGLVNGIWSSFTAAYSPELVPLLAGWKQHLEPDGWIALTEIDDLFGHDPLDAKTRQLLSDYEEDALRADRYDFHMGHKLGRYLLQAGLRVARELSLPDRELAFDGPADPEVLEAWSLRLERMKGLADFCGADFDGVRRDLLTALASPQHRSLATIRFCLGLKR
jgi:SAM-dependent methyltransferase